MKKKETKNSEINFFFFYTFFSFTHFLNFPTDMNNIFSLPFGIEFFWNSSFFIKV